MSKVNNFVATLDELLRFLESYEDDLFYLDINPSEPPDGARQFDITTFPAPIADRVMELIHPGVSLPRLTPKAKTEIEANRPVIPPFECGMNIQPKDGFGYPIIDPNMANFGWVRYPFQASKARFPSVDAAIAFYDPVIDAFKDKGVKTLLVLTHELYGEGVYDWQNMSPQLWQKFQGEYLTIAEHIVKHVGSRVDAFEIWNEGDVDLGNPAGVTFPPEHYASFLAAMSKMIQKEAPKAKIVTGGLVHSPGRSAAYLRTLRKALGGTIPVDAIGIHPYGKGSPDDNTVFSQYGNVGDDIALYYEASGGLPMWFTEVGAGGTHDPQYWDDAAIYIRNLYGYLGSEHNDKVHNAMWYAWSDKMHISERMNGLMTLDDTKKEHVYDAFMAVACGK